MKNFLYKQREIIAVLIYAAFVAGLFYLFIFPLIARIDEKSSQIQEESLKQEIVRKNIAELPKIEQQYETLQKNGDSMDILLDRNNAVVLIEKLEKLAEDNGTEITIAVQENKVEQQKTTSKTKAATENSLISGLPNTNYLQMKITMVGKYVSIMNVVRLLENFEYYADIIGIEIIADDGQNLPSRSASNAGMFGTANGVSAGKANKISEDDLEAALDVVFYTK